MPIFMIALIAISLLMSLASMFMMSMPKTPQEDAKFQMPTAEVGKPIGVLFGTKIITDPSVVTYGDFRIVNVDVDMGGK